MTRENEGIGRSNNKLRLSLDRFSATGCCGSYCKQALLPLARGAQLLGRVVVGSDDPAERCDTHEGRYAVSRTTLAPQQR